MYERGTTYIGGAWQIQINDLTRNKQKNIELQPHALKCVMRLPARNCQETRPQYRASDQSTNPQH